MKHPYLKKEGSYTVLMVNDQPFLPLGGEFYNSSTSSRQHMNQYVWPGLRRFTSKNTYLAPVSWQQFEPQQGHYDFSQVDGLIEDARREDAHLVLLWFGVYKNGDSYYLPQWLKSRLDKSYFIHDHDGNYRYMISPFRDEVYDLDALAFAQLMKHLRIIDSSEQTVVMVQVENEMGIMKPFHDEKSAEIRRDCSEKADILFDQKVCERVAAIYGEGTWKEVFGEEAERQFMAFYLSLQIEKIAAAGKKEYPIVMYINSMPDSPLRKMSPYGGPDAATMRIWKLNAPSIDFISPDIYGIGFSEVLEGFITEDNPIFIPECTGDINSPSRLFCAIGMGKCLGYSVMGIDKYYNDCPDLSRVSNGFGSRISDAAGDNLGLTYQYVQQLFPEIIQAHNDGRLYWFSQQTNEHSNLVVDDLKITVNYGISREPDAPLGGGLLIKEGENRFLLLGINCELHFSSAGQLFNTFKQELLIDNGIITEGRLLNGDELTHMAIGKDTAAIRFELTRF